MVSSKAQSVDGGRYSFSDYPRVNRNGKEVFDHLKILDWIKTWLDKEHGGNIPNPYRFGVGACVSFVHDQHDALNVLSFLGNSIWANYTGINDFWGYDKYGHYGDFPRAA